MRQPQQIQLQVAYHDHVERLKPSFGTGQYHQVEEISGKGWYIEAWYNNKYRILMNLRFAREKDAIIALESLKQAGITSYTFIKKAGPEKVIQIACQFLQW